MKSPIILKEIFSISDNKKYNLRSGTDLSRPILHITDYRTEPITNLGAKIWELVSQILKKQTPSLVLQTRLRNA